MGIIIGILKLLGFAKLAAALEGYRQEGQAEEAAAVKKIQDHDQGVDDDVEANKKRIETAPIADLDGEFEQLRRKSPHPKE